MEGFNQGDRSGIICDLTQAARHERQADEQSANEREITGGVHGFGSVSRCTWAASGKMNRVKKRTQRGVRLSHACDCFDRFCGQAPPATSIEFPAIFATISIGSFTSSRAPAASR